MHDKRSVQYVRFCIVAAMAIFATACIQGTPRSASYFSDYTPFDLGTRPEFSNYQEVVGSYLRQKAVGADTQACVVGLTRGSRETEAVWIIWRKGDRLIRWFAGENNLDLSSRNLSLTDDVVPTDADIGSSTYLVSRPWVDELERVCEAHGHQVAGVQ